VSNDPLRKLALSDRRYAPEAYQFLFESLDIAVSITGRGEEEGQGRHVSGQELLEGMRLKALELFGPLAGQVWRSWGVRETMDWGHVVFALVDAKLLNRQETDTIEDFRGGYDFDEAFVDAYEPKIPDTLAGETD